MTASAGDARRGNEAAHGAQSGWFIDFVLHLDKHLVELLRDYGLWVYLILFLIVFAETGFVVTPFLPGDSLLFAAGALAAMDTSGTLSAPLLSLVLVVAAITGNTTNYHIGRWIGPPRLQRQRTGSSRSSTCSAPRPSSSSTAR